MGSEKYHKREGIIARSIPLYIILALACALSVVAVILASIALANSSSSSSTTSPSVSRNSGHSTVADDVEPVDLDAVIAGSRLIGHNLYLSESSIQHMGMTLHRLVHIFTEDDYRNVTEQKSKRRAQAKPKVENLDACQPAFTEGASWKSVENYMISTSNVQSLNPTFTVTTVTVSLGEWNAIPDSRIFGNQIAYTGDGPDLNGPDGKNEWDYGPISTAGVLGFTVTWGIFTGAINLRVIFEWDTRINDRNYTWGNAKIDSTKFHLKRVVGHESGHAAGLGHSPCSSALMYAFTSRGQVNPESPTYFDALSICGLYHCSTLPSNFSVVREGANIYLLLFLLCMMSFWK